MINVANLKMAVAALAVIGSVAIGLHKCSSGSHGARLPGSLVVGDPVQDDGAKRDPFERKGYTIAPFARFTVRARLLSSETYRMGREADLSPIDFALGWNDMSNDAVLARLSISQGNRFYYYRWESEPPIPVEAIVRNSANMHLIPASDDVHRQLERVRPGGHGHVARLAGRCQRARRLAVALVAHARRHRLRRLRADLGRGGAGRRRLIRVFGINGRRPSRAAR